MASNYVQPGNTVSLTAPYNVVSGGGFKVGAIFAVAAKTAGNGTAVEGHRTGVFRITKLPTDTGSPGAKLYWDDTNKRLTTTASTHILAGHALETMVNPSSDVLIALTPGGA